jgi:hypothetical protein
MQLSTVASRVVFILAHPVRHVSAPRYDIIAARRTEFVNAAAARGLKVVDGVAMIRHQWPLQTAFWKGET